MRSGYRHDGAALSVMDWFCGAGGSSQGVDAVPGVEVIRAANHWDKAIETHAMNFPAADHYLGDIREAPVERWPVTDIFWASPECFPAGTLILTARGLLPIEEVVLGDEVFTHQRRWRQVVATMHRPADTVRVKGVGLAGGVETTREHPFLARPFRKIELEDGRHQHRLRSAGDAAAWVAAGDLHNHLWASPIDFGELGEVPEVAGRGMELTADFWWLVGRWLGDGSMRRQPRTGTGLPARPRRRSQPPGSSCIVCGEPAAPRRNGVRGLVSPYCSVKCKKANQRQDPNRGRYELTVVCGFHEVDELAKRLNAVAGLRWQRRSLRTATAFTTAHRALVDWIVEHFGQHAHGKTIPAWALSMNKAWRAALLDGYLSADGSNSGRYTGATTVSKQLAVGLRLLANSLGHVANLAGPYQRKPGRMIEGRPVNERPSWSVQWITEGPKHAFHVDADGLRWAPVRSVEPTGRRVEVYNITVDEDESYVADGIVVHNCPQWSNARGKRRDFDTSMQDDLFGETVPDEAVQRSRALMEEVPLYLRGVIDRGGLVKAGVVENVVDVRAWDQWDRWLREIRVLGYSTRVIAMNSMHAAPAGTPRAPQSRDRLYVAYWHRSLGRDPEWEKWLRPAAVCECGQQIQAVQVFKRPGADMGRYRQQYVYRSPHAHCRAPVVEPHVLPAAVAIDWNLPGTRIGDRPRELSPKTLARIEAGLRRYARPITLEAAGNTFERRPGVRTWPVDMPLTTQTTTATKALAYEPMIVPAGGTWRTEAVSVGEPMPTRTTRENDGIAIPPLLVPVEGRDGKDAAPATQPLRTQTARNETGLAWLPFIAELRGGASDARPVSDPLATVTASGNLHGLVTPASAAMVVRQNTPRGDPGQMCTPATEPLRTLTSAGHQSLVTYYGNGRGRPTSEPVGALTTRDRYALVEGAVNVEDVLFRMLEPHEIGAAMAFVDGYQVIGSKRERVRMYGNAVTPPVAEVIVSALVEAITGEALERAA